MCFSFILFFLQLFSFGWLGGGGREGFGVCSASISIIPNAQFKERSGAFPIVIQVDTAKKEKEEAQEEEVAMAINKVVDIIYLEAGSSARDA